MVQAELVSFIFLASACTFLMYRIEDRSESIISCLFGVVFWVICIPLWYSSATTSGLEYIAYAFLFPIGLTLVRFYEIVFNMDDRRGIKNDPFMEPA